MKEKKHTFFFKIAGLFLWVFAATTNIFVLANTVDFRVNTPKKIIQKDVEDVVDNKPKDISNTAIKLSFETSLRVPLIPEPPPDSNSANIKYYEKIIERASVLYMIDPDLISAMVMVESRFKPQVGSKKGAKGLLQLLPTTAKELGVVNILHPEENILAGAKYLRQLLDKFEGDVELALAAYNAGYRKVLKYQGVPPFKETQMYINKIFNYYTFYKIESLKKKEFRME